MFFGANMGHLAEQGSFSALYCSCNPGSGRISVHIHSSGNESMMFCSLPIRSSPCSPCQRCRYNLSSAVYLYHLACEHGWCTLIWFLGILMTCSSNMRPTSGNMNRGPPQAFQSVLASKWRQDFTADEDADCQIWWSLQLLCFSEVCQFRLRSHQMDTLTQLINKFIIQHLWWVLSKMPPQVGGPQDGCILIHLMLQNFGDTCWHYAKPWKMLWYRWCAATKNVGKGAAPPMTNFGSMVRYLEQWLRRLELAKIGAWSRIFQRHFVFVILCFVLAEGNVPRTAVPGF